MAGPRRSGLLAAALWLIGMAGAVTVAGFAVVMLSWGDPLTAIAFLSIASANVAFGVFGWLILRHQPGHRIGWLYLATPILLSTVFVGFAIAGVGSLSGASEPVHALAAWVAAVSFVPMALVIFPLVALLFPDGSLPGPRWRWPLAVVIVAAALSSLGAAVASGPIEPTLPDNPFGIPALGSVPGDLKATMMTIAIVGASILAIASMVVRFARGRRQEREQLKWVLLALLVMSALIIPSILSSSDADTEILDVASFASLVLLPLSMTVAILRYRLYDIDRLISRTLAYVLVTGVIGAAFVGTIVTLQALLTPLTQGQTLAVAGSTLVAVALFQPVRRRIQRAVDRRFDRRRADAHHEVDTFASRVRDEVELATVIAELDGVVRRAMAPSRRGVWVRRLDERP